MRRPLVLFSPFSSNRHQRGVLRHALLASAWSVPAAISAVAQNYLNLLPLPLYTSSHNNNSNNRHLFDEGNSSENENKMYAGGNKVVDTKRLFLRKGRGGSAATTTSDGSRRGESREAGEEWETSTGVDAKTMASGGSALQAFHHWSEKTGSCSPHEFAQGVQQSYYGLGALLGTLADSVRPQTIQAKSVPLSGALTQLKSLLIKQYGVAPSAFTDEATASDQKSGKKDVEEGDAAKVVAQALMQVLPISPIFAEELFSLWNKQRTFEANLFCVAGPTDYILSTELVYFHGYDKAEVHAAGEGPFKVVSVPFASPQGRRSGAGLSLRNFRQAKKNETSTNLAGNANISTTEEVSTTSGPAFISTSAKDNDDKNNDLGSTHKSSTEGEEKQAKEQTIISYMGKQLPPIPADALAFALATVDVVTPPQRYAPTFDWFYKRITGYENEYERIAAARIFAMSNAHPFVVPLDFLLWMFTGRHVEFICKNGISAQIGIPKNIGECPPATRKMMCFYMDTNRRWVLSGLLMVDSVLTTMLPKDAAA